MNGSTEEVKTIVLVYEPRHIEVLPRVLSSLRAQGESPTVVALDREVELRLEELRIPFCSGREYQSGASYEQLLLAEAWTKKIFDGPEWKFFAYRGVPFTEVFFSALQVHLQMLLYFADITVSLFEKHRALEKLVVLPSLAVVSDTSSYLAQRDINLPLLCAKAYAPGRAEVVVPGIPYAEPLTKRMAAASYTSKRLLFSFLLKGWNTLIRALRTSAHPRILVSDYWRNIAPVFERLKKGEMVLLDRSEFIHISLASLWRFRMRFSHIADFEDGVREGERKKTAALFAAQWKKLADDDVHLSDVAFLGLPLRPLIIGALGDIMEHAVAHTLAEVDGAYEMIQRVKPDSILLRTSVSSQTHFPVLAFVGKALGVPSIELQHGLEYLGPGSGSVRHVAGYVGVYGPLVREEMERAGFPRERLPLIGSPRFDQYAQFVAKTPKSPSKKKGMHDVLCICPIAVFGECTDSYAAEEYLAGVGHALREVPGSRAVIKLRPGPRREWFYKELIARAFAGVPYTIAQYEPLIDLYAAADAVVSGYSTAVLEALQCHKPVVLFTPLHLQEQEALFHFKRYADAGALALANSPEALAEALGALAKGPAHGAERSQKAHAFMEKNYSFDGKASERLADLFERARTRSAIV